LTLYFQFINLPSGWKTFYDGNKAITFYFLKHTITKNIKAVIEKQIIFTSDTKINYFINDQLLEDQYQTFNLVYPFQLNSIEKALTIFSLKAVCLGGPSEKNYPGELQVTCYLL